jgi:hypothetical protein
MAKVAVLGCGPAGLLAAHGAALCGHNVTIFSKKQKSPMQGAQYMHIEIPDIRLPEPGIINYTLVGSVENYRKKVYKSGDTDITVSPQQYQGVHKCWDLRLTYAMLWGRWSRSIVDHVITHESLTKIVSRYDFVFSTIPAQSLCLHQYANGPGHEFSYVPVWIDNMWSGPLPQEDPELWVGNNLVICNGLNVNKGSRGSLARTGWYRTSHIYHHTNTEWTSPDFIPDDRSHPPGRIWRVRKPIGTNCDCWPTIIRAGRYGKWTKGVLTHQAFEQAVKTLS